MVINESIFQAGKPRFKYAAIKEKYDAIAQKKAAQIQERLDRKRELQFIEEQAKLAREQEVKRLMQLQNEKTKNDVLSKQ